jgi:hypothetical protein
LLFIHELLHTAIFGNQGHKLLFDESRNIYPILPGDWVYSQENKIRNELSEYYQCDFGEHQMNYGAEKGIILKDTNTGRSIFPMSKFTLDYFLGNSMKTNGSDNRLKYLLGPNPE